MIEKKDSTKIGIWTSTSLVIGNMIGSGVFLLPASLAFYGGISLFGWLGSSIGALVLAALFSHLSKLLPNSQGGPYAYSKSALGDFAGFLVAWGYWISILFTNAAITVTFVSYLSVFFPALSANNILSAITGLGAITLLTWVNTKGLKTAGKVQVITTIMKLTPLIFISFIGIFYIDLNNFTPFNTSSESNFAAISATATLTFFAYLGVECATIPADNIERPEITIPRATMIGTIITIFVYVMGSLTVMGMIPASELKNSSAPFADTAAIIWGDSARYFVAFGALISTFGALNGWILLQGQMPLAAARDNLFPDFFKKENKAGVPVLGVLVSSVLIAILMIMNYTKGLNETFTFFILISTVAVLVPYLFSSAAYGIFLLQNKNWKRENIRFLVIAVLSFLFSMWAILGSGQESVYYGLLGIFSGIPFYVWMKRKQNA
jgi:APA family basic amino acid/polyamine antiporter